MNDFSSVLTSDPLDLTLDEIRLALDQPQKFEQIYNPDRLNSPEAYDLDFRAAAVLIPIWQSPDDQRLYTLLTQRALHMRNHPGQIAFPGGKHDPDDASIEYTALRETMVFYIIERRCMTT